ncbi:MAG: hypothetical protein ACK4UU_07560, partial [Fimbriimonadales bacterium]
YRDEKPLLKAPVTVAHDVARRFRFSLPAAGMVAIATVAGIVGWRIRGRRQRPVIRSRRPLH